MDKIYFFLLGIVLLAFVINILLVTKSSRPASEVGAAPVVQMVLAIPLFLISAIVFFFTKDLETNTRLLVLLLPLILQLAYFAFTKDLFSIFGKDNGAFVIRSYVYAMGLSTALGVLIAWIFGILSK